MPERWTCSRCSTENDPWVIGCSNCGAVRSDLSAAGAPAPVRPEAGSAAAPPPGGSPQSLPPATPSAAVPPPPPPTSWTPPSTPPGDGPTGSWNPAAGMQSPTPGGIPLWRRLPVGWIVIAVLVAAGAVGGLIFNASRDASGEITKSGDLTASELRVGDCFDLKDPAADEIADVTALPCTSEHEYETFFVGSMPEGDYPDDAAFEAWLVANCDPAFEAYIGTPYIESELDIFWLQPTQDTWISGDRSIQCAVYHPRISRLTESLKGSAR